jgi:hypothetical protein
MCSGAIRARKFYVGLGHFHPSGAAAQRCHFLTLPFAEQLS